MIILSTSGRGVKIPRANTSPEAVALREAAMAFAANAIVEPHDDHDREGQWLNAKLLRAARRYAAVANRALRDERRGSSG